MSFLTIYVINWIFNQWNIDIWGNVVLCLVQHQKLHPHNHHQDYLDFVSNEELFADCQCDMMLADDSLGNCLFYSEYDLSNMDRLCFACSISFLKMVSVRFINFKKWYMNYMMKLMKLKFAVVILIWFFTPWKNFQQQMKLKSWFVLFLAKSNPASSFLMERISFLAYVLLSGQQIIMMVIYMRLSLKIVSIILRT